MKKLIIGFRDDQHEKIREIAYVEHKSMSQVVREAVEKIAGYRLENNYKITYREEK